MKRVIKKEEYEVVKHNNLINIKSKFPLLWSSIVALIGFINSVPYIQHYIELELKDLTDFC